MKIESKIAKLEDELVDLRKQKAEKDSHKMIQCGKCKKRTQIRKVTYLQTHWYTSPYSCTGGDYWNAGEGQFICPKCKTRNRLLSDKAKKWCKYKNLFAEVKDVYDDDDGYDDYNRYRLCRKFPSVNL